MFMATGTLNGGGTKAVKYIGNHIIPIQITGDFSIHLGFRHFHMSNKIPWPCRQKTKCHNSIFGIWIKDISRNLFLNKLVVRLVAIERTNHIVTVWPGIGTQLVLIIPTGIRILGDIKPVPAEALTIPRRSEQTVDQFFISMFRVRCIPLLEYLDFIGGRRQACEIKSQSTDQYTGRCGFTWFQILGF